MRLSGVAEGEVRRVVTASVLSVVVLLMGCGDGNENSAARPTSSSTATPNVQPTSAVEFVGTYDVELRNAITVVGSIAANGPRLEAHIIIDANEEVRVHGAPDDRGRVQLNGEHRSNDTIRLVEGHATLIDDSKRWTLTGEVIGEGDSLVFTMRRPRESDPEAFEGQYLVRFERSVSLCGCESSAAIQLDVSREGVGASSEASDAGAGGPILGKFLAGNALISPEGRVVVSSKYVSHVEVRERPVGTEVDSVLVGQLEVGPQAGTGNVTIVSAPIPPMGVIGDWVAASVP